MKKRLFALLMVAALVLSMLAGCSKPDDSKTTAGADDKTTAGADDKTQSGDDATTEEQKVAYEDLPTINVVFSHGYSNEGDDNKIWRAVAEAVGAKIHFIGADADKLNTMLVSGEGWDIYMSGSGKMKEIATGGSMLALDDLLKEQAPEVLENIAPFIKYSKESFSDDSGALYWLPAELKHLGKSVAGKDDTQALIRWDVYKSLGYPEVKNLDEYLDLIADMVKANPKNAAGETVYGMALTSDKLMAQLTSPFTLWQCQTVYKNTVAYNWKDMSYQNVYGEGGSFWAGIDFYHKAYQMGLLDPDSFAMKEEDMKAKATAGRLMFINNNWQAGPMENGQGFSGIPLSFTGNGCAESNASTVVSFNYGAAINKKSKLVEECINFLQFGLSEEGANFIYNGIEGIHWTKDANGVRSLTAEGLALYKDSKAWAEAGLGTTEVGHFIGLAKNAIGSDGKAMLLGLDSSIFKESLTDLQKEVAEHYKVDYPAQIFIKTARDNGFATQADIQGLVRTYLPTANDEIAQLEAAVVAEAESLAASLIMASDSEYDALVKAAKDRLAKVGVTKIDEYFKANWQSAFDKAAALTK